MPSASVGEVAAPATPVAAETGREPAFQVRDVLYPTDLAPESERAFEHARFLAERFQARLTLYHAVEFPDPVYVHWGFNRSHAVWLEIEKSARQQLLHKAETLSVSHGVEVEREIQP